MRPRVCGQRARLQPARRLRRGQLRADPVYAGAHDRELEHRLLRGTGDECEYECLGCRRRARVPSRRPILRRFLHRPVLRRHRVGPERVTPAACAEATTLHVPVAVVRCLTQSGGTRVASVAATTYRLLPSTWVRLSCGRRAQQSGAVHSDDCVLELVLPKHIGAKLPVVHGCNGSEWKAATTAGRALRQVTDLRLPAGALVAGEEITITVRVTASVAQRAVAGTPVRHGLQSVSTLDEPEPPVSVCWVTRWLVHAACQLPTGRRLPPDQLRSRACSGSDCWRQPGRPRQGDVTLDASGSVDPQLSPEPFRTSRNCTRPAPRLARNGMAMGTNDPPA